MTDSKVIGIKAPEADVLNDVLKQGAQALLRKAVEAEVAELLAEYRDVTVDGKRAVVRNGHLPERTAQTGIGDIPVKVPKVRDRSGQGIKFNSQLLPPYLKRTRTLEEFIPSRAPLAISEGGLDR